MDLRERICAYVEQGHSARIAACVFGLGTSSAIRFVASHRAHGSCQALPHGYPAGRHGKLVGQFDLLDEIIAQDAGITLAEMASALEDASGINVSVVAIHKVLKRAGYTFKKRADRAGASSGWCQAGAG